MLIGFANVLIGSTNVLIGFANVLIGFTNVLIGLRRCGIGSRTYLRLAFTMPAKRDARSSLPSDSAHFQAVS